MFTKQSATSSATQWFRPFLNGGGSSKGQSQNGPLSSLSTPLLSSQEREEVYQDMLIETKDSRPQPGLIQNDSPLLTINSSSSSFDPGGPKPGAKPVPAAQLEQPGLF
jgi:hypothetical protein